MEEVKPIISQNTALLEEIKTALEEIKWGSIEIYIQNSSVVQITKRHIKKIPSHGKQTMVKIRFSKGIT